MRKRIWIGFVLMIGIIVSKGQQETKTPDNPLLKATTAPQKSQPFTHVPGDARLNKMSTTMQSDSSIAVNPNINKSDKRINKTIPDK
jgi:hypothetical protein